MNALFAGIDVSLAVNKALFIGDSGEDVTTRLSLPNNALGAELFAYKALELCSQLNPERVLFGLEPTSMYSWHLAMFLNQARTRQESLPSSTQPSAPRTLA